MVKNFPEEFKIQADQYDDKESKEQIFQDGTKITIRTIQRLWDNIWKVYSVAYLPRMYTVLELDEVEPGTKTVILMNYIVSFQEKLP